MSSTSSKTLREQLAGPLIREDVQLVGLLVVLAVAVIVSLSLLTLLPISYRSVYYIAGVYAFHLPVLGLAFFRLKRHYSLAAMFWFFIAVLAWGFWNQLIWWVSVLSGWWATSQPVNHIAISGAVGLLPLLAGIWILGSRLRKSW